ncbi:hypothetical protein PPROV_000315100 [Pycnococcus provasolii]|uniref:Uncharacterized protein n=1 Tax=Pycnococcus provasolii TaxID=41880 RepID=A0A830HH56_9CHLO|nr:hypothetical protein PPROV_000315100 [Pycnococcus provasolii]
MAAPSSSLARSSMNFAAAPRRRLTAPPHHPPQQPFRFQQKRASAMNGQEDHGHCGDGLDHCGDGEKQDESRNLLLSAASAAAAAAKSHVESIMQNGRNGGDSGLLKVNGKKSHLSVAAERIMEQDHSRIVSNIERLRKENEELTQMIVQAEGEDSRALRQAKVAGAAAAANMRTTLSVRKIEKFLGN